MIGTWVSEWIDRLAWIEAQIESLSEVAGVDFAPDYFGENWRETYVDFVSAMCALQSAFDSSKKTKAHLQSFLTEMERGRGQ